MYTDLKKIEMKMCMTLFKQYLKVLYVKYT